MRKSTSIVPAHPSTITGFLEYFKDGHGSKADHFIDSEALKKEINICEAWFWRAKAQKVLDLKSSLAQDVLDNELARKKIPRDLQKVLDGIEEAIGMGAERALAEGFINQVVDNDFAIVAGLTTSSPPQETPPSSTDQIQYKKYALASDHQIRDMGRVAEARLAALGWFAGIRPEWEWTEGQLHFINPLGSLWSPAEE
jgi:hypothetical protein